MVQGRTCSRRCGEVSDEVVLGAHSHQLQGESREYAMTQKITADGNA